MKPTKWLPLCLLGLAMPAAAAVELSAESLFTGIVSTVIYGLVGIAMAAIGYKVIDWLTPGNLKEQIADHENRALAIVTGSMILGVSIIIAAVLVG